MLEAEINEAIELAQLGYDDEHIADYFFPLTIETLHDVIGKKELCRARLRSTKSVVKSLWSRAEEGRVDAIKVVLSKTLGWGNNKTLSLANENPDEPLNVIVKLHPETVAQIEKEINEKYLDDEA